MNNGASVLLRETVNTIFDFTTRDCSVQTLDMSKHISMQIPEHAAMDVSKHISYDWRRQNISSA